MKHSISENKECQLNFRQKSDESKVLTNCLMDGNAETRFEKWFKTLKGEFHKSFKKVRYSSKKKLSEISLVLEERRSIIQRMKICQDDDKEALQDKLTEVEESVCDLVNEENYAKVV